jgi:hypothetical protein
MRVEVKNWLAAKGLLDEIAASFPVLATLM